MYSSKLLQFYPIIVNPMGVTFIISICPRLLPISGPKIQLWAMEENSLTILKTSGLIWTNSSCLKSVQSTVQILPMWFLIITFPTSKNQCLTIVDQYFLIFIRQITHHFIMNQGQWALNQFSQFTKKKSKNTSIESEI